MQPDLALARQVRVAAVADRAARQAAILWRKMGGDFDAGWAGIGPTVSTLTARAQIVVAAGASNYLTRTANADGTTADSVSGVLPTSFAGVDASGRTLDGLLYGAVTSSKTMIGRGAGLQSALNAGGVYLSTMVRTATLDTARSSNLTAMTAHRYTHYLRGISAGACSRCAMLAGIASARTAFLRHPGCRCMAVPVTGEDRVRLTGTRLASPTAYFQALPPAEQDRVFGRAAAESIRAGADPVAVVSARRGARGVDYSGSVVSGKTLPNSGRTLERAVIGRRADGTPVLGYVTGEGTTVRGGYTRRQRAVGAGRQVGTRYAAEKRIRLMPETIVELTDDVGLRRVLLRDAGYLDLPFTPADMASNAWIHRREDLIREDRRTADAFYRTRGITLG